MLLRDRRFLPYAACLLGVLSLLSVLCFHFPELLTSREFRVVYTPGFARTLLLFGLVAAFVMGTVAVLRDQSRRVALVGVGAATLAILLGGTDVQVDSVGETPYSLGLDWFVLSLFFSALVFIPLEQYLGRRKVSVLRPGWRTDVTYFFMSHVLVQFFLILVTATTSTVAAAVAIPEVRDVVGSLPGWAQFVLAVFVASIARRDSRLSTIALIGTTIERNVTSSRMNVRLSTNRNTIWDMQLHDVDEVLRAGGQAGHRDLGIRQLADGGRDNIGAQDLERALGRGVGAAALDRQGDDRDGLVGADVDRGGLGELTGGDRLVVQLRDGGLDRRGRDVLGLDHGRGGDGAAGEGGLQLVVGLDDRLAARVAVEAGLLELDAERGDARATSRPPASRVDTSGRLRTRVRMAAQTRDFALGLVAALGDPRRTGPSPASSSGRGTRASRARRSSSRAWRRRRRASCRCRSR